MDTNRIAQVERLMPSRDLHIPSFVQGPSTETHPFNRAASPMQTIMYRTRKPLQYQSSVSAVHKLQQLAAKDAMIPVTSNYSKRSLVSASAFSDPTLDWSTEVQQTTIREVQQRVVSANAMVLDQRPQHWPGIGLPPPLKELGQSVPQYSPNQDAPPHFSAFHEIGKNSSVNPMYANNSAQKIGCADQHYGVNRHSAFSRPPASSSAFNSLDVEIRRLQEMITRVEMLREKYKHQDGTLHYPNALPSPHASPIYRGTLPAPPTRSDTIPTWYSDEHRPPTDLYRYPNIHPLQHDALQNHHPSSGMNKMNHREQFFPERQFPKSPEHTQRAAFLDFNQYDGMPKIVDVRSLADDVQVQHRNKKDSQNFQTYSMKDSPNARSCMRSTTDARKETRSVDSHDSGVECTSSPIEMQSKKNKQFVYGRNLCELPTDDEVLFREEHRLSMFHYQVPYVPTSIARSADSHRLPGPITSSPLLIQNPRKRLSHAANKTEVVAKKSKAVEDYIDIPGTTGSVSVPGRHDQALDLTLKKRNGHSEAHTNGVRIKTEPNDKPINSPLPGMCSCSEHRSDYCPSGMLHHHRALVESMKDPVDLSTKFTKEIPTRNTSEERPQQDLEVRNRSFSSIRQKVEGILHHKFDTETLFSNLAQGSSSIGQDKNSKDENTLNSGGSKSSNPNHFGKKKSATKFSPDQGQSPPKLERNPKSQLIINESLRMPKSPSSRREELALNSPLEETDDENRSVAEQSDACHSPGKLVINDVETENCNEGACGVTELQARAAKSVMHGSLPASSDRAKDTSFSETQEAPQNVTTCLSYSCTQTAQTKPPEPSFPVRQLKPFFQYTTGKLSKSTTKSLTDEAEKLKIKFAAYCNAKVKEIVGSKSKVMDSTNSAPDVQVPAVDGIRRLQKVGGRVHEIYRVTTCTTKENHPNRKLQVPHSVLYREMSFPCVLRSEVPFIPTHLLVQILFPGVEVATVCRALQRCNILNRYMTRNEQDALKDDLRERGVTSCKLVPLDELHDNWDELLVNLNID